MSEANTEVANTSLERASGLLGLARRAGGVVAGTEAAREAIRTGHARLIVVALDVSPVQSAKVRRTLAGRPVQQVSFGSKEELGAAVGLPPVSVVAVTHARLATELLEVLEPRSTAVESFSGAEA